MFLMFGNNATLGKVSTTTIKMYKPLQVIVYDWSKNGHFFATWFIKNYNLITGITIGCKTDPLSVPVAVAAIVVITKISRKSILLFGIYTKVDF